MKDLSFYEQAGIVLPGSILLFGLSLLVPVLKPVFMTDGVTVGGLGLFLVIAYAAGHLVAAAGNFLERVVWWRGMPSDWLVNANQDLLGEAQIALLGACLRDRLGVEMVFPLTDRRAWRQQFAQIYRDVITGSRKGRVETFNGNYGLNRGLATSSLALAALTAAIQPADWIWWSCSCTIAAVMFIARMRRFGVNLAREVLLVFVLPRS